MRTKILDNHLLRMIAKAHMIKGDFTADIFRVIVVPGGLFFLLLVQKFKHALGGCRHGLEHIDDLRNLLNGLGKVADILNKCLNIADGNAALRSKQSARQRHADIAQVADKHGNGLHHAG